MEESRYVVPARRAMTPIAHKLVPTGPLIPALFPPFFPSSPGEQPFCGICERPSSQVCAMCNAMHYCSNDCQRAHFFIHLKSCRVLDSRETIRPGVPIDLTRQPLNLHEAGTICTNDTTVLRLMYCLSVKTAPQQMIAMLPLTDRSPNSYRTSILYTISSNPGDNQLLQEKCDSSTPVCILQVINAPSLYAIGNKRKITPSPKIKKEAVAFLLHQDYGVKDQRTAPMRLDRGSPPLPRKQAEEIPRISCVYIPTGIKQDAVKMMNVELGGVLMAEESIYIVPGTGIYGFLPRVIV